MNKFPMQPCNDEGPVFSQPWEAQAFSLVIALHGSGAITWQEWSTTLADVITAAQVKGDDDRGGTYYQHWLLALERLAIEKGLASHKDLSARIEQWRNSYLHTPHGQSVLLHTD